MVSESKLFMISILVTATIGLSMTGCEHKANEDELMNALNSNKDEAVKENEKQIACEEQNEISQHVNYTIEGDKNSSIIVDADVKTVDPSKLAVYEIKQHGMDDIFIKKLADQVFDNGVYEYQKPYYVCSEEELDAAHSWLEGVMDLYEEPFMCPKPIADETQMWVQAKESLTPDSIQNIPEGQYYVTIPIQSEIAEENGISEMSMCKFTGKIQGKDWVLSSLILGEYQKATLFPCFQNEAICSLEPDMGGYGNDICAIDKKDGETKAKDALDNLDYGDYSLINVSKTLKKNADDTATMNGYLYTFARSFNGIDTAYLVRFNPEADMINRIDTPQEYVSIYVDSFGVEQIDFSSHYEVGEVLMEAPTLLGFDKIDEVAKKKFKESLIGVKEEKVMIDKINLEYMAVADKNSKFSFVPVWIYHMNYQYGYTDGKCTTDLCINAIDGTIVNNRVSLDFDEYIGF